MANNTIPLSAYRVHVRKARIEIVAGTADLILPGYFGRRRWSVPLSAVGVADLTSSTLTDSAGGEVFRGGVDIPYLFTTGPVFAATTLLLFKRPQRVPPLTFVAACAPNTDLPFGYLESRSANGAQLDGVLLRAVSPCDAAEHLIRAGAQQVTDPADFLRRHRDVVDDPVEREAILQQVRVSVRLARASTVLVYATLLGSAYALSRPDADPIVWAIPALGGGLGILFRRMASGRLKRPGTER